MFATYEAFKFPLQFGDGSTIWRGVEIMLNNPWLIATLEDDDEVPRTFLLKGLDDLLHVMESSELGKLTGVRLVLPPYVSPTSDWSFVHVCRVERELRSSDGAMPSAVLKSNDGRRYGGFPIHQTHRDEADLIALADFPVAAT